MGRHFAMELKAMNLLVRSASGCNRSPHALSLLGVSLELMRAFLCDDRCRQLVVSYAEFIDLMIKLLIGHFGKSKFFDLAADCLLVARKDPRLSTELGQIRNDKVLYNKRSLLVRLGS